MESRLATLKEFEQHPEIARRFADLHPALQKQAAVIEADRCLNCFDAPCTAACPTHIDVPRFIKKIASGNLLGSALGILEANVLAASCSRVCPVEVLCEGACVLHHQGREPIAIGQLQRHAMDAFHAVGGSLPRSERTEHKESVACIGAGPASLAAAAELRQRGYAVTVFDKRPLPGGLNTYGVAEYKLSASASLREIELIAELGVTFRFGVSIDAASLAKFEKEFAFLFLGVGLGTMHRLDLPGSEHPSVVDALQFIEDYKLGLTTSLEGSVIVIGAGNTAIDAACAAKRLGAEKVSIVYRRTFEHISAFALEYQHALSEGIEFHWLTQPIAVHATSDGMALRCLECVTVALDTDGKLSPIPGSDHLIPCDLVIPAIGQSPLIDFLSGIAGLRLQQGRIVVDRQTGRTTNPKYFAGGDCINGGREVVDAVADGKRSAVAIAQLLDARRTEDSHVS
jgi:dihydropyrimidine dehydrogenase (NAD+) subunit PreT